MNETHLVPAFEARTGRPQFGPLAKDMSIGTPTRQSFVVEEVKWWHRAIPLSKGRHHLCSATTWPGEPLLRCESFLEFRVIKALARREECAVLATQPVTIAFRVDQRAYRYTPDIVLVLSHATTMWERVGVASCAFIEAEPSQRASSKDYWPLRQAVVLAATGIPLVRITEQELDGSGGLSL